MKNTVIIFIISALIGLGIGALYFNLTGSNSGEVQTESNQTAPKDTQLDKKPDKGAAPVTVNANTEIFTQKGCLQCHSISELNLKGGVVGPDLSQAYATVEGKHGKPLAEFLKAPTSATMSGVIKGNPLTDEERAKIVDVLKGISGKE